jgi:hypothetical protein
MITACLFEEHARAAGLGFVPLGEADEFEAMIRDPRIWKIGEGSKVVMQFAAASTERYLTAIESCRSRRFDAGAHDGLRRATRARKTRHTADHRAFAARCVHERA